MSGMAFGGGLVGVAAAAAVKKKTVGVKGPIHLKVKDRKRPFMIPAHTIQNSMEMLEEMQRLSGVTVNQED